MASFQMLCYQLDKRRVLPYAPVRTVTAVTPVAGDVVTYRSMGEQYTDTVLAVAEFFDSPAYLIGKVWVSGGQIVGIIENVKGIAA